MTELEIEFRVYRSPDPSGKRECIVARSIPHALQAWQQSVDSFSRSLELVISGDWLMKVLEQSEQDGCGEEIDGVERAAITKLCIEALAAQDATEKQALLKQVLALLGYDPEKLCDE